MFREMTQFAAGFVMALTGHSQFWKSDTKEAMQSVNMSGTVLMRSANL
jgi:hypothetical protein